jgi:hypothetical protein
VFVRVESRDGITPERILVSADAAATFRSVLEARGPLSMAWSPNGTAWAGGADGLFRFSDAANRFIPVEIPDLTRVTCVASHAQRMYACGYHAGEFGVLVSADQFASLDWFLRFPQVTARLGCSAASDEGTSCGAAFADWSAEQRLAAASGAAAPRTSAPHAPSCSLATSSYRAASGVPLTLVLLAAFARRHWHRMGARNST